MADNPMNAIFVPSPSPVEVSLIQVLGITNSGSYIEAASSANFDGGTGQRDVGMFSPKIGEMSRISAVEALDPTIMCGGFILEKIRGPLLRRHLELRSKNPNDNPSVTFNYFQNPLDLQRCIEGIIIIEKVIQSKALKQYTYDDLPLPLLLNMSVNDMI